VASIKKKIKNGKTYYYLKHHAGKRYREIYLGKKIPKNIRELSRNFELQMQREKWHHSLTQIKKNHSLFLKTATKSEIENQWELFSYDFTHDSNKIEGSSLTRKETYKMLRFKLTPTNKPEWDMFEAKNHHEVFLDMLRTGAGISSKNVLDWHYRIFKSTKPQFAGLIRKQRIAVTGSRSTFPHPNFVPALLKQFFKWYNNARKTQNPVELAGLVHFRFVSIHPFGDGNGRISRLMMNNALNQQGYPMLNIKFSDRDRYYSALERAHVGLDELIFLKWFMTYYITKNKQTARLRQ
jgi:Fic family protein